MSRVCSRCFAAGLLVVVVSRASEGDRRCRGRCRLVHPVVVASPPRAMAYWRKSSSASIGSETRAGAALACKHELELKPGVDIDMDVIPWLHLTATAPSTAPPPRTRENTPHFAAQVVLYSLPELDGAIDTMVLGGLVGDTIGLVPERVRKMNDRIKGWVDLRRTPASERKVAVLVYGFPPNVGAVSDSGCESEEEY